MYWCRVLKLFSGFPITWPDFYFIFIFTIFSNFLLSNFKIFPPQQTEPNIIRLHITALQKVTRTYIYIYELISAFSCNTFSSSLFSAQSWCSLSSSIYYHCIKNHTQVLICVYPLHCFSFNIDWFGASSILPKIMHTSFILETFRYK